MKTCPQCGATNRPGARFCVGCGQGLPTDSPQPPSGMDWKGHLSRWWASLRLWGRQAATEAQALVDQLRAGGPAVEGVVGTPPRQTRLTQAVQFYVVLLPVSTQTSQVPALTFRVDDRQRGPVNVLVVGDRQGTPPAMGDAVQVWGQWNDQLGGLRAWRVWTWQRGGRAANELLTVSRPVPWAAISAALLISSLACCLLSTCLGR